MMQRIPTAFQRDPESGLVTAEYAPGCQWVAEARTANRKWDGVPILLDEEGVFSRGIKLPPGAGVGPVPDLFKTVEESPDGWRFGWKALTKSDPNDQILVGVINSYVQTPGVQIAIGEYEVCGPGIKDNHERLETPWMFSHRGLCYFDCPVDLESLIFFLVNQQIEGVIFRQGNARAQLTRRDVGLDWPPTMEGL